jgi:hypothetical protein
MMAPETDSPGRPVTRCARCGDVIGVYEPLVHVVEGVGHHTSRATEPRIVDEAGPLYHGYCYEPDQGGGS